MTNIATPGMTGTEDAPEDGRSPSGSGSQASPGAPDGSPPSVSIPNAEPTPPTPGPWKAIAIPHYEANEGTVTVTDEAAHHFAIRYQWQDEQGRRCTRFVAEAHKTYGHESECEPNARLIAAAPELLEALEPFASLQLPKRRQGNAAFYSLYHEYIERAQIAIAKARGQ